MGSKVVGQKPFNRINNSRVLIVIKDSRIDKTSYDLFVNKGWGCKPVTSTCRMSLLLIAFVCLTQL